MVGGSGQDVSRTVPGDGKPHPDKAVPSLATSGTVLPARSFPHQHRSRVLCWERQRELCRREGNKNLLTGMIKSCHLCTFAVIMEIFIKGCSCVFPYALIKGFSNRSGQGKPGFPHKQPGGFGLTWLMLPEGNWAMLPRTVGEWAADDLPHQILPGP